MPRQINFLAERHRGITKEMVRDWWWLKVSAGVCVVVVFLCAAALAVTWRWQQQASSLLAQREQVQTSVAGLQDQELAYLRYIDKVSQLSTIYTLRQNKNETLAYINGAFGSDVSLVGIDYDQEDRLLRVTIQMPSIFVLGRVVAQLQGEEFRQRFPDLTITQLQRSDEAKYTLAIGLPRSSGVTP